MILIIINIIKPKQVGFLENNSSTVNLNKYIKLTMNISMWSNIQWPKVRRNITRLQRRIYQATIDNDKGKIYYLQNKLINSPYAKLWSVKQVTQLNKGRKTPGVDRTVIISPSEKSQLARTLNISNNASPIRRVFIPKPGKTEKRPLGIPTIRDRAIQALVKLALEPQWEARFEPNSYGFRPGRSCHDAIQAIHQMNRSRHLYVFDADINKCFDKIDHEKLLSKLDTPPKIKSQIKAWLTAGIMEGFSNRKKRETIFANQSGTPQGGIISPLLANIALHGLETAVKEYYSTFLYEGNTRLGKRDKLRHVAVIRYADDFVVLHNSETILYNIKDYVQTWLSINCGLEISEMKSSIKPTSQGFEFLGFHIISINLNNRIKCKVHISEGSKKTLLSKTRTIIQKNKSASSGNLILLLNPLIVGWCNYFRYCECVKDFKNVEYRFFGQIRAWVFRRRSKGLRSRTAIKLKYFPENTEIIFRGIKHKQSWILKGKTIGRLGKPQEVHLVYPSWIRSEFYIKIQNTKSPYDGDNVYWTKRNSQYSTWSSRIVRLYNIQKGLCPLCGKEINNEDRPEVDHIKPVSLGGKDVLNNLQVVHDYCHTRKSARESSQRALNTKSKKHV